MISIHQGKLLKGFFTKNVSVHPEINESNKTYKKQPFKKTKFKKNIISPSKKTNTCEYN